MAKPDLTDYTTGKGWELWVEHALSQLPPQTMWHRNEPPMRNGFPQPSGIPDYIVIIGGQAHYIECKAHTGTAAPLGTLDVEAANAPGIEGRQAAKMDRLTAADARCWVAASVCLPSTTQQALHGSLARPSIIRRLIPWPTWRALLAASEATLERPVEAGKKARRQGASIPWAELAKLGHPLNSAADLLKALATCNHTLQARKPG